MPSAGRRNRSWTTATLHLRWLPGMARQRALQSMAVGDNALGRRTSWDLSNFWWDAEASSDVYFLYLFVCIVWSNCSQEQVLFFKHLVSTCLDRPFELILFWAVYQLKIAEQTCSVDIPFLAHSRRCLKGQNRSAMLGGQTFHTFSYHLWMACLLGWVILGVKDAGGPRLQSPGNAIEHGWLTWNWLYHWALHRINGGSLLQVRNMLVEGGYKMS